MHVRFSTCKGAPVTEWGADVLLGTLAGLLINPDTGKLEGIFVGSGGFFAPPPLFCASEDIAHWGAAVQIRSADALAPIEDRIRLASLVAEGRLILDQQIRTESGRSIGICRDVQIDTERLRAEWLFPRKFLRWGVALPFVEVIEVRPDAIIVRDPAVGAVDAVAKPATGFEPFPEIADPSGL